MADTIRVRIVADQIGELFRSLTNRSYPIYGPTARDGAIVYDRIEDSNDLPQGLTEKQEPGKYSLVPRSDDAYFGYVIGPHSWKKFFHPARVKLFEANSENGVFRILDNAAPPSPPIALIGVRACELAAISIQDKVLRQGPYADAIYQARRQGAFLVAVQCTTSAATCFCASMGTGPAVNPAAADITLTEMAGGGQHWFLAESGSERGTALLAELPHRPATEEDCCLAAAAVHSAGARQQRHMETRGLRELLLANFEHPRWDDIAGRCLDCANCTMVCPTCFCTDIEDTSNVTGTHADRWRRWDSCFTTSFSYIHGGSVRTSGKSRYRQWMTHKLASWIDQFGSLGCVGCGRCITWCPSGIDITEEAQVLRGALTHGNA